MIKSAFQRVRFFFIQVYVLLLNQKQREKHAWKWLKNYHVEKGWWSGFYEKEKRIKSSFYYSDSENIDFWYAVEEDQLCCRVPMIQNFPPEYTTDIFILSAHFNNILNVGRVEVNTGYSYVEYNIKTELLTVLINPDRIKWMMAVHYNISIDVIWAFRKLIQEQESPAFIIAELMQKRQAEKEKSGNAISDES